MLKIRTIIKSRGLASVLLSVTLTALFVVTAVNAATTISTNIDTGGTLTVIGVGHLQNDLNIYGNDLNIGTGIATSTISGGFGIGIGTTTPGAAFAVATGTAATKTAFLLSNLGSNYTFLAEDSVNDSSPFVITAGGNVGVGSSTPFVALGVTGTTTSSAGAILGINGSAVNQILFGACTLDSGFIQASSTLIVSCTGATGVTATDKIFITATKLEYGLSLVSASSTTADAISIAVHNNANASTSGTFGSGLDPISTSVSWMAIK